MKLSNWFLPLPHDREGIYNWLIDTGFIERLTKRYMNQYDIPLYQDYLQSIYVQIFSIKESVLIDLSYNKPQFTNYMKRLVYQNIRSLNSKSFQENKKWKMKEIDIPLDDFISLEEKHLVVYSDGMNEYELKWGGKELC